jgi:3-oxoacyl-[acyl-carrier-protein] synthase II
MENRNHQHRVVITGMGLITPLGHNVPDTWAAILAGRSGLGPFTLLEKREHVSGALCEVKGFDPNDYMDRRDARRRDRSQQLATAAAAEAMGQANLAVTDDNRERIGIILGTGVGGIQTLVEQEHIVLNQGLRRISPFAITMIMPNGASGMLAIDYGIHGPSTTITTACAAGADAVGHAFGAIRRGELDAVLTGGSESILASVAIGGFERAGATSTKERNTPSHSIKIGTAWWWVKEPACWSWRAWRTPRRAGRLFLRRWQVTARQLMPTTLRRRPKAVRAQRGQLARPWAMPM